MKEVWKKIDSFICKVSLNKWYYIIPTLVLLITSFVLFQWEQNFDLNHTIKSEVFGQFGDFFAGILGPIFSLISILLLIRTFNQQSQITKDNKNLSITQRFNDTFFGLLNLYQEQTDELEDAVVINELNSNQQLERITYDCNNKDFFDLNKTKIQQDYEIQRTYSKNRFQALADFSNFYIKHKSKIGIYYRTLFRIYDLIDNSDLNEQDKINYSKIIRAQLTESELFFLRYNAMSYSGSKFSTYLNKYNVLKHIPHFELLEFKYWWSQLNNAERNGIDVLLFMLKTSIKKLSNQLGTETISRKSGRYVFRLNHTVESDFNISIVKDNSKTSPISDIVDGLDTFSIDDLERLFDCWIKEIVIVSNFNKYNKRRELDFYNEDVLTDGEVNTIITGVRNSLNNRLNFRYPHISNL